MMMMMMTQAVRGYKNIGLCKGDAQLQLHCQTWQQKISGQLPNLPGKCHTIGVC